MKKLRILPATTIMVGLFVFCQGCSKYTESVALEFTELKPKARSTEYYEALKAYKNSDHAICFGWWGASGTTTISPDMSSRYEGLPDSMDIVSLWGGYPTNGPAWEEMQSVRKKKGTRFVWSMFGSGVEKLIKKNDSALLVNDTLAAIDNVAKAMGDTINKYQIDGFDLDYEPGEAAEINTIFGSSFDVRGHNNYVVRLFEALGKYLGPKSGSQKLLLINGYYESGVESYINFYVQQAYNSRSASALQNRFEWFGMGEVPAKKFVVTENMQQYGASGVSFMHDGQNIGSVLGMAYWNPTQGRKGGFGGFIIERDVLSKPSEGYYYHLRKGIQIQNPAPNL